MQTEGVLLMIFFLELTLQLPENGSSFIASHSVAAASHELGSKLRIKRLPQAIIIGVKKGGTRALLEFLKINPRIRTAGPEVHFFDLNYHRGLNWYRDQMPFSSPDQVTIEKTPSYFVTRSVPSRIFEVLPQVRLIIVVRDPVTRAISDYTQVRMKRPDMPSFEHMCLRRNRSRLKLNRSWIAIRIGLYAIHLQRWMRYFPKSRIHFVSGEELARDPVRELAKVQDFLGVERYVKETHFYFNQTKGFHCLTEWQGSRKHRCLMRKAAYNSKQHAAKNLHCLAREWQATGLKRRCLGQTKGRRHPAVSDQVIDRLRTYFRPFNQQFYNMTGIDFDWS